MIPPRNPKKTRPCQVKCCDKCRQGRIKYSEKFISSERQNRCRFYKQNMRFLLIFYFIELTLGAWGTVTIS